MPGLGARVRVGWGGGDFLFGGIIYLFIWGYPFIWGFPIGPYWPLLALLATEICPAMLSVPGAERSQEAANLGTLMRQIFTKLRILILRLILVLPYFWPEPIGANRAHRGAQGKPPNNGIWPKMTKKQMFFSRK